MEATLKDLNAVLGVKGSFVCSPEGDLLTHAVPGLLDAERLSVATRVLGQTVQALDTAGQHVLELDLAFGEGRLIVKVLRGGMLGILCVRTINLPLLNLTANVTAKKIAAELKAPKAPSTRNEPAAIAPAPATATPSAVFPASATAPQVPSVYAPPETAATPESIAVGDVSPSPLYVELEQEAKRLIELANQSQTRLCVMAPIAVWNCCPHTRRLLAPPPRRHIDFLARTAQAGQIVRLLESNGYESNKQFNATYGRRRVNYLRSGGDITVDVFFDVYEMYHRLDLTSVLARDENILPETPTTLLHLQVVEMPESSLSDLCALLLEHDLSFSPEKGKIDLSQIARLCGEDWGWFKTVSLSLDRLEAHASASVFRSRLESRIGPLNLDRSKSPARSGLSPSELEVVTARVQQIRECIDTAPRSLRWETRARLGEAVRWYEVPPAPDQSMK